MSAPLRVGSLCSGYGGLEMGAEAVLGPLEHVWHGEFDAAPSAVLAARWPGVPNLGDIAAVTAGTSEHGAWADQAPIDCAAAAWSAGPPTPTTPCPTRCGTSRAPRRGSPNTTKSNNRSVTAEKNSPEFLGRYLNETNIPPVE